MPKPAANVLLEPVSHEEAARWIEDKPLVSRQVFDSLLPELRARAFLITGIEDATTVAEVRSLLASVPRGADWVVTKKAIMAKVGPWLTQDGDGNKAAASRAELLLRTHGFQAYQVASHRVLRSQEAVFPYWQYLSLEDELVRPGHAALNGKVFPADSPFWHDHSPPWQWGCRCRKTALLADEVDALKQAERGLPPEKQSVMEGPALDLAEQGRLYNVAGQQLDIKSDRQKGKDGGFVFDADALTMPLQQLKARYDAVTWAEFETQARKTKLDDGRTVLAWLQGVKAPKVVKKAKKANAGVTAAAAKAAAAANKSGKLMVSDALTLPASKADQAVAAETLAVIDRVHEDGVLPSSVMKAGQVAEIEALGDYSPATNAIRFARDGDWPMMTVAHEVGHFLDLRGLGPAGRWASVERESQGWKDWWKAVEDSAAYRGLTRRNCGDSQDYFRTPWECWARAYAQFIAQEGGSQAMRDQLNVIRNGFQPWRQWTDDDFQPVAAAIRALLTQEGWIK